MPRISVIVPIYNTERFLRRCLDSLVNQTLKDVEVILVNDASPDGSHVIMKEYAERYKNVRCIYLKENLYQGGARNRGIEASKGEYITFVDSDDYVDVSMLEKLYGKIKETGADFVYCHCNIVEEDGSFVKENVFRTKELEGEITHKKIRKSLKERAVIGGHLYRRCLWTDNHISFPKHLKFEDICVIPIIVLCSKSCACVLEPLYYYVTNSESSSNMRNANYLGDMLSASNLLIKRVRQRKPLADYEEELEMVAIVYYGLLLTKCVDSFDEIPLDLMRKARRYMWREFPRYRKNKYYLATTGEERFLMALNHLHPWLAFHWGSKWKKPVMKMLGRKKEALIYYKKYYIIKLPKITKLFELFRKYDLTTSLYGASLKKYALVRILDKELDSYIDYDMTDAPKNKLSRNEVLTQDIFHKIDLVYVINPSFLGSMYRLARDVNKDVLIVNLEDYLNGFIGYDYYERMLMDGLQ